MKTRIDEKTGRDARYAIIKVMYDAGNLNYFRDIFLYIPKTVVARDAMIALDRFSEQMAHLDQIPLKKLFQIGGYCELTEMQIMTLVMNERADLKAGKLEKL